MRIISGQFRGRRLVAFQAKHIRPTTDRVKETLFNKLSGLVEGARVLDLFSGTGNLGLEAVSRGAEHVDFVESHPKSVKIIRENMALLGLKEGVRVYPIDVFKYINEYSGEPYDIIFVDPPFTKKLADSAMRALAESAAVGDETRIMIEASRHETLENSYGTLKELDRKDFGDKCMGSFQRE